DCPGGCAVPPSQCFQAPGTCDESNLMCSFSKLDAGTACEGGKCDSMGNCLACGGACTTPPPCQTTPGACMVGACMYPNQTKGTFCQGGACDDNGSCQPCGGPCNAPPTDCYQPTGTCTMGGQCAYSPKLQGTTCNNNTAICDGMGNCGVCPGG